MTPQQFYNWAFINNIEHLDSKVIDAMFKCFLEECRMRGLLVTEHVHE